MMYDSVSEELIERELIEVHPRVWRESITTWAGYKLVNGRTVPLRFEI